MARKKMPETLLREAVEKDDNLAILKAHRKIVLKDMLAKNIEFSEKIKLSSALLMINKEVIKLEGSNSKKDAIDPSYIEDSSVKDILGGEEFEG